METYLERLTDDLPGRLIHTDGKLYMERYYLKSFHLFGKKYAVFIQRFNRSDAERELHNHPWKGSLSFILVGLYFEYRLKRRKDFVGTVSQKCRRFFNFLRADTFHRVVLPVDERGDYKPVWTLFIHGPATGKQWGFLHPLKETPSIMSMYVIFDATFEPFEPHEVDVSGPGRAIKKYRDIPVPSVSE